MRLACQRYAVTLTTGDSGHRPGHQPEQTNEQPDPTGVVQLRARDAERGPGENSIHQATVTLRPIG